MTSVSIEILLIVFLVALNGIFALSEMAIVAARKARLKQMAAGDARVDIGLAENPNRFLSTVQIGITLVGILAGAFGGATIAEQIAAQLQNYERLKN
jgi:putative hemolysin